MNSNVRESMIAGKSAMMNMIHTSRVAAPGYEIPFNKPFVSGNELVYLSEALRGQLSGDGQFTRRCHELLERELGASKVLLTTSCTHALELAAILLNCRSGDEVVFPSFTFVSTVNPFVLRGVTPVFADIRPDTLNIDETAFERLVTSRTKVVVPVHYAGVACNMEAISAIATAHDVTTVEDNAHGLFGKYRGRPLGTFGALAAQSFHETKNVTCGEGGALIINDARYTERAEIIREKGTNRTKFFRGEVDKYGWVDVGSSYLPSELLAGFLYAQLEAGELIQSKRRHVWCYYSEYLRDWAQLHDVRLPVIPDDCEQSYHMFYLLLPSPEARERLIEHLRRRKIHAVFHYLPLHLSEMGRRFGGKPGDCPVTEDISERLLRLPFYCELEGAEQARVVEAVRAFRP